MSQTFQTALKNTISAPSKNFQDFITQYFEDSMYIIRGEYDFDLPSKLQGEELEVAKKITTQNIFLTNGAQSSTEKHLFYLASKFDLKDLIPFLKERYGSVADMRYKIDLGLLLYKWGCLDTFVSMCTEILSEKSDNNIDAKHAIINITYSPFLEDFTLKRADSLDLLWIALQHPNFHLRDDAFYALCLGYRKDVANLTGLEKIDKILKEKEYYIVQNVYENKELFESRIESLKKIIDKDISRSN